jgi:3'-phosphoadenosine 5'-phosphosulfate sulfotransferase (PAPS reductase)/FAD synthetase
MTDAALFPESDAYNGDPLAPDRDVVTPVPVVAALTRSERESRVLHLIDQARDIYTEALDVHLGARKLIASCLLWSGGNDSTSLAHMFRDTATHAIHANTTIGIEQTRQFVRDTCAAWELPLIEERADDSYEDLVLGLVDGWPGAFPGPGGHGVMYQRLKERALDKARHTLGVANSRKKAAVFIAGRRREESKRREDVPAHEADGTVIWVSPLVMWTKLDLTTYRLMNPDIPRNEVADLLHMSGECLCGAFAKPGELDEIRAWFPEVAAEIDALSEQVRARGADPARCVWGHGIRGGSKPLAETGRLCQSCDNRFAGLFDAEPAVTP